ncbi:hypothetical protein IG631_22709 [Alternaria alternata]|nr:hypothetical protein IG631_22709 [Alternaria alternata]
MTRTFTFSGAQLRRCCWFASLGDLLLFEGVLGCLGCGDVDAASIALTSSGG